MKLLAVRIFARDFTAVCAFYPEVLELPERTSAHYRGPEGNDLTLLQVSRDRADAVRPGGR